MEVGSKNLIIGKEGQFEGNTLIICKSEGDNEIMLWGKGVLYLLVS